MLDVWSISAKNKDSHFWANQKFINSNSPNNILVEWRGFVTLNVLFWAFYILYNTFEGFEVESVKMYAKYANRIRIGSDPSSCIFWN